MSAASHNSIAPAIVRQIVEGANSESQAMVILESVTLGLMLYYRPKPREAGEFLDTMTAAVIERMGAKSRGEPA
jgi:hypothetical protein